MESCPTSTVPEAIGRRFKAGLQSVLNGLNKSATGQSPERHAKKMVPLESHLSNGYKNSADHQLQRQASEVVTVDETNGDAILGESEEEDAEAQNCDDTLLEGIDLMDDSNSQPASSCTAVNTLAANEMQSNSKQLLSTSQSTNTTEAAFKSVPALKVSNTLPILKSLPSTLYNETRPDKSSEDVSSVTIHKAPIVSSNDVTQQASNNEIQAVIAANTKKNSEPIIVDENRSTTEQDFENNSGILNNCLKSTKSLICDNPQKNGLSKVGSSEQSSHTLNQTRSLGLPKNSDCPVNSDVKLSATAELTTKPGGDSENSSPIVIVLTSSDFNLDASAEHLPSNTQPLLSPEELRADVNDEVISPPQLNDEPTLICQKSTERSNQKNASSKLKRCMKDLNTPSSANSSELGLEPELKECQNLGDANFTEPTMVHKCKRESHKLYVDHKGSTCITSDDEDGHIPCKKAKLSSSAVEPDDRLNKLISHLSTALDEPTSKPVIHEIIDDEEDDGLEPIHLKKNGLASFYDAIIKSDVVKDSYHEELKQRHKELRIKNNMDSKKIQKILHEMKSVREKLKLINIRPAQRSVSTQLSVEKLQVPLNHSGVKVVKSTVLSHKALSEQRKAIESAKLLAAVNKGRDDWQAKQQSEANAVRLAEQAAKKAAEDKARIAAAAAAANRHIKSSPSLKPPSKTINSGQKIASSASNEVIDLTSEEDSSKPTSPMSSACVGRSKPTSETLRSQSTMVSTPQPIHPAPLPQCPLTGQSGDLLKPNAPRLELTSKEDGIVLQWSMTLTKNHARIATYQIFGYKERPGPITGLEWKKVGDLKALPLPMACTLTQFQTGHKYHFAVRAVDELGRTGPFGAPRSTKLN
ncbi:activating transcription factor 7-interacting protein 2-like [Watersipora subatra]|uniref:activating transcription factor 7-interacting protein 2-like n=1 Tax=Watersipora subatra TaxID=2589382 RepID=UPI00355C0F9B